METTQLVLTISTPFHSIDHRFEVIDRVGQAVDVVRYAIDTPVDVFQSNVGSIEVGERVIITVVLDIAAPRKSAGVDHVEAELWAALPDDLTESTRVESTRFSIARA